MNARFTVALSSLRMASIIIRTFEIAITGLATVAGVNIVVTVLLVNINKICQCKINLKQ